VTRSARLILGWGLGDNTLDPHQLNRIPVEAISALPSLSGRRLTEPANRPSYSI
jgi:hypothetical protein